MARLSAPLRLLICLLALSLLAPPASAQDGPTRWQALGGPGGRVTRLAAASDGKTVYAVSVAEVNRNGDETQTRDLGAPTRADALYKSVDGGQRWTPLTNDLPPGEIAALFVDRDDALWVGLQRRVSPYGGELWSSADAGATWRQVQLNLGHLRVRSLAQSADGDLWLLASAVRERSFEAENSLYRRSADGVWAAVPLNLSGVPSTSTAARITAHPTDPRLFLTTDFSDLLLSVDGGQTWVAKGDPPVATVPAQLAFQPDQPTVALLVRVSDSGLILERSQDSGDTWSTVSPRGLPDGKTVAGSLLAAGNGVFLMTTDRGVYRSADGGDTWQALEGALDTGYVYQVLRLPNGSSLLAATAYGLFASGDRGALWRETGAGLPPNSAVLGLLTHPNRPEQIIAFVRAVGATQASLMLVSRDGGASWLPAGPGGAWTDATAWAVDPRDPDRLYIAGARYAAMSKDGGVSWQKQEMSLYVGRSAIAIAPSDPQRIYIDGAPRLRSDDGGETWIELPPRTDGPATATGVAVDPADANHVWYGMSDGVFESRDGGRTVQRFGLDNQSVRWLRAAPETATGRGLQLFAGVENVGVMRWNAATQDWQPAQKGLPTGSNILAFAWDPQSPGLLWATRDGGGIYASGDGGANWQNAGRGAGDNLGLALAPNYGAEGGWLLGTATAGLWLLGVEQPAAGGTPTPPGPTSSPAPDAARSGVDARIEVVWPHNFAPLSDATLTNVGLRLFLPRSLEPPSCGWRPSVELWRAENTEPAERIEVAEQRTVDGQPFPYWDANDVDVSPARDEGAKVYFLVKVDGVDTATSVWAHAADARTFFPEQLVPSGIATGAIDEVDARIQIVWPHDEAGNARDVKDAPLVNVAVTLFKRGTRLSVPLNWRPPGGDVRLIGAWNSEVSRLLDIEPVVTRRQSGVTAYPVWEFNDVPVDRARNGVDRIYLWTAVDGVRTYPTIWAHGLDSRTYFPARDEPVLGCLP